LPQLQPQASGSSTSSSPRGGSFSASSAGNGSASSNTSYSASVNGQIAGHKTPSPEQTPQSLNRDGQPLNVQSQQGAQYVSQQSYGYPQEGYNSMNQMQAYSEVHPSHMSAATAHAPSSAAPSSLSHYSYPQPAILQPGPQYASAPPGYPPYGYSTGVPSQLPASASMSNALVPQAIQLPGKITSMRLKISTNLSSNDFWRTDIGPSRLPKLSIPPIRSHRTNRTSRDETQGHCNLVGR
jgi:protein SOK2